MAWNVSGRLSEACSCNVACPCWFGVKELMVMDQGWCATTFLFEVGQGNSDGVNLSGRTVVVAADFPGPTILDGNGTARLYIDAGANADQKSELEGIFSGAKGGPMAILAGLMTTLLPTQSVTIDVQEDGDNIKRYRRQLWSNQVPADERRGWTTHGGPERYALPAPSTQRPPSRAKRPPVDGPGPAQGVRLRFWLQGHV